MQLKRAIKRGEVERPEPSRKPHPKRRKRVGPTGNIIGAVAETPKRLELQSAFIKSSPEFLEESRSVAAIAPLPRPIPPDAAVLSNVDPGTLDPSALTCPQRPRWRFDMSKLEVERNEEGQFKKWLERSDQIVEQWQKERDARRKAEGLEGSTMPPSPTYFERNLEVWRQL